MYVSILFSSEIDNGAEHTIAEINEELIKRLAAIPDDISSFIIDSTEKVFQFNGQCDENVAFGDVCKDFEDEILIDLPIIKQ